MAEEYNQLLKDLPLKLPSSKPNITSSFHLYVIRLKKESMISHKYFFESLRAKQILVNLHYIPVYFHPFYQKLGFKRGYCPNAEEFYSTAVSIPMFTRLTHEDQLFVTNSIKESLGY